MQTLHNTHQVPNRCESYYVTVFFQTFLTVPSDSHPDTPQVPELATLANHFTSLGFSFLAYNTKRLPSTSSNPRTVGPTWVFLLWNKACSDLRIYSAISYTLRPTFKCTDMKMSYALCLEDLSCICNSTVEILTFEFVWSVSYRSITFSINYDARFLA